MIFCLDPLSLTHFGVFGCFAVSCVPWKVEIVRFPKPFQVVCRVYIPRDTACNEPDFFCNSLDGSLRRAKMFLHPVWLWPRFVRVWIRCHSCFYGQ